MGYVHGSVSGSPCGFYGGADLCGAAGSPVVSSHNDSLCGRGGRLALVCQAMANLKCSGSEWSVEDNG